MTTSGIEITEKGKNKSILFYCRSFGVPLEAEIIELTILEYKEEFCAQTTESAVVQWFLKQKTKPRNMYLDDQNPKSC